MTRANIREHTTKIAAGAREILLDPKAAKAIRRYVNDRRSSEEGPSRCS